MRARRIEVTDVMCEVDGLPPPGYASAFEIDVPGALARSAEDWARSVFEGAPWPVRGFIRTGWRFPLRFDLAAGKPGAAGQVLGARISSADAAKIVLEQRSPAMLAHNIATVEDARIVWVTAVRYRRPIARPLWAVSAAIHHRVLPYLLARAARTSR